jgi:hypothetical protein
MYTRLQPNDPASTYQLHISGKTVDYIDTLSSTIIGRRDWNVDNTLLETTVTQLKQDLPTYCESLTPIDLIINFINEPSHGDNKTKSWDTAEAALGSEPRHGTRIDYNYHSTKHCLAIRLQVDRG